MDFSIKQGEIKERAKQSKGKEKNEENTKYMYLSVYYI
jgi:hypothetical protein